MDLSASITYQGCLVGVQKYDFTNDQGSQVQGVTLHVSTQIPPDSGAGYVTKKMSYKGPMADFSNLCNLVGLQVLCSMNNSNGVTSIKAVGAK